MILLLELKNLTALRNDIELFRCITITLRSGDCLELSGANGSGKSTLKISTGFLVWRALASRKQGSKKFWSV